MCVPIADFEERCRSYQLRNPEELFSAPTFRAKGFVVDRERGFISLRVAVSSCHRIALRPCLDIGMAGLEGAEGRVSRLMTSCCSTVRGCLTAEQELNRRDVCEKSTKNPAAMGFRDM